MTFLKDGKVYAGDTISYVGDSIALNFGPVVVAEVEEIFTRVMATVCETYSMSRAGSRLEGRITPSDLRRLVDLARKGAVVVAS